MVLSHPSLSDPSLVSPDSTSEEARWSLLESLDAAIDQVVLQRQHPISGLLPASTAHTVHGNYGDAWVRDCVYSIQCVWGLALAHRRLNDGATARSWELEQRVLALMRGLLNAMMRQAAKVERFKQSLDPLDALHAKYDTASGDTVVPDDGWGHLQIDATSLFLLQLAQLTRSGLTVLRSRHEADFIQNLIFYVARAYRVPDYGIWERGDKGNHGLPERNASSIGMAKAALEALDGLDLFGVHGDGSLQAQIPHGAVVRLRRALQGLLPRESASKEADSACLSVVGYPAWAVEDPQLVQRTCERIRRDLGGAYGYKRFRRDGHQTVVEDISRLHYERDELATFEGIESEWPLFLAYELVTACCEERWEDARHWRDRLQPLAVEHNGQRLFPELYLVPDSVVELERRSPGSQKRLANDNVPLLWTQSLTWLGEMLLSGLLLPEDLDPCGRRLPQQLGADQVLVALVPASSTLSASLQSRGIPVTDPDRCSIQVLPSDALGERLQQLGANPALGLGGHPPLRAETATTARFYRQGEARMAFLPAVLEEDTFYLADDPKQLLDTVVNELHLLQRHWRGAGAPLLLIPLPDVLVQRDLETVQELASRLASGELEGIAVQLAPLEQLASQGQWLDLPAGLDPGRVRSLQPPATASELLQDSTDLEDLTAAQEQELDEISLPELRARLWRSSSLREQAEVLELLHRHLGDEAILTGPSGSPVELRSLLEEIYHRGLHQQDWNVVRRCAGVLGLVHPQLEDALIDLLARQKTVVVGRSYSSDSLLATPLANGAIATRIRRTCGTDSREQALQQELLLALDGIARREPQMLKGTLTLQLGQLMLMLTAELAAESRLSQDQAFEALCSDPPHTIGRRLRAVLADLEHAHASLQRNEALHLSGPVQWAVPSPLEESPSGDDWLQQRIRLGSLQRVPKDFHAGIWSLLQHCRGLVIGDKLERRNRLTSALLLEKTPGEKNFATLVEHLLSRIPAPEYRQLCTECLLSLMAFVTTNPTVHIDDDVALDVVIGHAVRVGWLMTHPELEASSYAVHKADAWDQFYRSSPADCRRWQIAALRELIRSDR
ncbi:MAG: phosphorylase kinase [Synechococcaceae bacterium WB9_4xB_025]|nr:phosphorylase kinase [Synechococcaceae bacterium WB9_4xB_025]